MRTLLDQGFRYGLLCRKFKQFYRSHHSLVKHYSHSVTQHLRDGVDSQVRWWRIRILLVGAAVTGTNRFITLSFHWCPLGFFLLSFFNFFLFFHFCFVKFLIYLLIFFFLSFFFKFSFISFSFIPIFLIFFSFSLFFYLLSVSPLQLFIIWVCAFL